MDSLELKPEDDYMEKCGEIFVTWNGKLILQCTICENNFNFTDYESHIEDHFPLEILETPNVTIDKGDDDSLQFSPVDDESNSTFFDTYNIVEKTKIERVESPMLTVDEINDNDTLYNKEEFINFEIVVPSILNELVESKQNIFSECKPIPKNQVEKRNTNKEKLHICPQCGFSCTDKSNLLGHIRRHSSNKPYKCTECVKSFHTRTEQKAHLRSHTGEKPFLCTKCGQTFSTSSKLTLHIKRHNNQRDKECPICEMKFFIASRLRDHMAVHSDERPLKCEYCDASFKTYSSLKNHRKLHTNEKKYQCPHCPAKFNQNPGLYSHIKKKHSQI